MHSENYPDGFVRHLTFVIILLKKKDTRFLGIRSLPLLWGRHKNPSDASWSMYVFKLIINLPCEGHSPNVGGKLGYSIIIDRPLGMLPPLGLGVIHRGSIFFTLYGGHLTLINISPTRGGRRRRHLTHKVCPLPLKQAAKHYMTSCLLMSLP